MKWRDLRCGEVRPEHVGDAAEPRVIDLWPEGVPDLKPDAGPEKEDNGRFTNIHHPTLTVYAPVSVKANGTAIIYAATLPPQPERYVPLPPPDDDAVFDTSEPEIDVQIVEELPIGERLLRWLTLR